MDDNQFASIDRLVQFGLGVGVARQMVDSMNLAVRNAHVPGAQTPMIGAPSVNYFVMLGEKQAGPFASQELTSLIVTGQVNKDTYVWRAGMPAWEPAANVPEVLRLVALAPPPMPTPPPFAAGEPS
jgi:hypothetical protein